MVVRYRLDNAPVIVDVGGGYGGGVTIRLKDNGIEPVSFVASWESIEKTKDGQLAFANKRAEVWWKFREALDPDQPDGSAIALPPDPELRADLCAPTWKLTARGILLESKDGSSGFGNLRQRLGRSPGKGDAVVMAWSEGNAAAVSRHPGNGNGRVSDGSCEAGSGLSRGVQSLCQIGSSASPITSVSAGGGSKEERAYLVWQIAAALSCPSRGSGRSVT